MKKMMKKINVSKIALIFIMAILSLGGLALTASAQADSAGKEFVLVYTDNFNDGPGSAIYITSAVNTSGKVEIPGIGFSQAFSVTADTITTIDIPTTAEVQGSDNIENKGIHITANDEITVYFLNPKVPVYSNDAYLGLPVDILNVEYIVLAYQNTINVPSELAIAAPYDNTELTITPSVTTGSRTAGVPYTITLQKFQTYTLQDDHIGEDLTGTIIESSHPVAVFGGNRCTDIPSGYYACDHIIEQMTPVATWGKEFDAFPFKPRQRAKGDVLRVLASVNGTVVKINGSVAATINRGKFHELMVTAPMEISTSEPALVGQYLTGSDYEGRIGDPSESLVVPTEQFMRGYTFLIPTGYAENYVNVVTPTTSLGALIVDGNPVNPTLFTAAGTKGLSFGIIPLTEGSHTMSGSAPFGIYVYGYNSYVSYAYPGGLALEFINPRGDTNPPNCDGSLVNFTYEGTATDNRPGEDVNNNGVLDPGEDLNSNGLIDEDTGIFRVELIAGATNLLLTVDPFIPGDPVVRFKATLLDVGQAGNGTVKATDGAGNVCRKEISISPGVVELPDLGAEKYRWSVWHVNPDSKWDTKSLFHSWNDVWFTNKGQGVAKNVVATITCQPANVLVKDGIVALGDIPAGGSAWSKDFYELVTDMGNPQDPNIGIEWTVGYNDSTNAHHEVVVPQFRGIPSNCVVP